MAAEYAADWVSELEQEFDDELPRDLHPESEFGLEWESSDPAGSKPAQKRSKRWDERAPTHKEIERQSKQDDIAESKLIRSFVSQCATAYAVEARRISSRATEAVESTFTRLIAAS